MEIRTFRASPSLVSSGVLTRRGNLNTDGHRGRACEDSGGRQSLTAEGGDLSDPSRGALRRNPSCRHLDLGLPAAPAVRKCILASCRSSCRARGPLLWQPEPTHTSAISLSLWKAWGIPTHGTWQVALMKCKWGGVLGGGAFTSRSCRRAWPSKMKTQRSAGGKTVGRCFALGAKTCGGGTLCS